MYRRIRRLSEEYVRRASNFQTAQAKRKLSQKEKVLDKEIEYDESEIKGTSIQKARRLGEIILHSKHILLIVVVVNLLDCCLVLGELILDIHFIKETLNASVDKSKFKTGGVHFRSSGVKGLSHCLGRKQPPNYIAAAVETLIRDFNKTESPIFVLFCVFFVYQGRNVNTDLSYITELLHESEEVSNNFAHRMGEHYPDQLQGFDSHNIELLYEKLLSADCSWAQSTHDKNLGHSDAQTYDLHIKRDVDHALSHGGMSAMQHNETDLAHNFAHTEHHHSVWEEIAHGLHKASITLLSILVFETTVKILCMGERFFRNKLEVFDGFIVLGSFTLDLIFLKGLTVYRIQDGILILSFLLPWRVIRVVNSLIVAIIDHEHFRLKLLYKEKKTIAAELKELKEKEEKFESILTKVETFCEGEGIPKWKIRQHTATLRKQSTITSFASLALGGMLNGFLEQNQHRAVSKTHSEPVPHTSVPTEFPRQTSAPISYDISYAIAEENEMEEDEDNDSSNPLSEAFQPLKTQLTRTTAPVQIIVTPAEDATEDPNAKDAEQKPLLQRQDSVDHESDKLFVDQGDVV